MSRVFVVQRQQRWDADKGRMVDRFDFEAARQYGELIYCLAHRTNPMQGRMVLDQLREALLDYDFDTDYLLPVGNPCLIGAAVAAVALLHGKVRLLQWDKRYQHYDVVELTFGLPRS